MNSKEAGHTKPRVVSERQRNDRLHARLGSTTMQMKPKGKPKKDSKVAVSNQTRRTPHENAGIVSARQLNSIRTIVDGTQKRIPGDGKENQSDQVHSAIGPKFSYETNDDAIINSVMQQVARLNRDKLSEDSLVKVLTSVYLDAKSKLADKDRPASIRMDSNDQRMSRQVETTTNLVDDSRVNGRSLETDELRPSAAEQNLSFGERKKRQWEKERAELAALTAQDPWSKPNSASSSTAPQSASTGPRVYVSSDSSPAIRSTVVDSVAWSGSDSALTTSNSNMFGSLHPAAPPPPPALTPMAFAVHEDAELHKRLSNGYTHGPLVHGHSSVNL